MEIVPVPFAAMMSPPSCKYQVPTKFVRLAGGGVGAGGGVDDGATGAEPGNFTTGTGTTRLPLDLTLAFGQKA